MPKDDRTVEGFGRQWTSFDQRARAEAELRRTFDAYFAGFPWETLPDGARGVDVGAGSGRWARFAAEQAASLVCVDASPRAVGVARDSLTGRPGVRMVAGSAGELPLATASMDFGYSLGVLHHTPDPQACLDDCVRTLRPGAPFLVYLYYALDGRPRWYRALFTMVDGARRVISRLPYRARITVTQLIAAMVYLPLARLARAAELAGLPPERLPLAAYRAKPFYVMRTDALDRFGTRVEHRFTREQVAAMMTRAGLEDVEVYGPPYWCAVGKRV